MGQGQGKRQTGQDTIGKDEPAGIVASGYICILVEIPLECGWFVGDHGRLTQRRVVIGHWARMNRRGHKGERPLTLLQKHTDLVVLPCTVQRHLTSPVPYEYIGACAYGQLYQGKVLSFSGFMEDGGSRGVVEVGKIQQGGARRGQQGEESWGRGM